MARGNENTAVLCTQKTLPAQSHAHPKKKIRFERIKSTGREIDWVYRWRNYTLESSDTGKRERRIGVGRKESPSEQSAVRKTIEL